MIKVVLIDVDDTILDFYLCSEQAVAKSAKLLGVTYSDKLFNTFLSVNDGLWKQIEKGLFAREQLYDVRWNLVFDKVGITADGHLFEKSYKSFLNETCIEVKGAREIIEYLSKKYILCLASNASSSKQQLNRMQKADLLKYFDKYFISGAMGATKPSAVFFDKCLEELKGIKKDELLMLGDSLSADINGCVDYGIKACWFNKYNVKVPENLKVDFVINKLTDLYNIL